MYWRCFWELLYMILFFKILVSNCSVLSHRNTIEFWKTTFYSVVFFKKNIYFLYCIFSPSLHSTQASLTPLPHLYHAPWFCPCVLYSSSYRPLSPLSLPHAPVAIVTMFLISMSLVIFCLLFSFVDYVPVKGEIIWYLSLPARLISFSITLSSSIHAIAKGISSFFLSAAQNSIV